MALAIFSIGLMAVSALQTRSLMDTGDVARRIEAWTFAEEQATLLKQLPFYQNVIGQIFPPALVAGDFAAHSVNVPAAPLVPRYTVYWRVVDNTPLLPAPAALLAGVPAGFYTVSKEITLVVTRLNGNPVADEIAQLQFVKTWAATGIPNPPNV